MHLAGIQIHFIVLIPFVFKAFAIGFGEVGAAAIVIVVVAIAIAVVAVAPIASTVGTVARIVRVVIVEKRIVIHSTILTIITASGASATTPSLKQKAYLTGTSAI